MNKLVNNTQRQIHFDLLRILSMFMVILIHVVADAIHLYQVGSFTWFVGNVYDSLARFCVPVFVMISGAFMLDPEYKCTIKKLYSVKILRMVTALVFWGLVYGIYFVVKEPDRPLLTLAYQFIYTLFTGYHHMWFVFMIIGLYIITPILRKIVEDKKITQYFLLCSFAFSAVFMFAVDISDRLMGINAVLNFVSELLAYVKKNIHIDFLLGYAFYYVLGYYLKKYSISRKIEKIIYIAGILSFVFIMVGTYALSVYKGKNVEILYEYLYFPVCFEAVAVFMFFKEHISKIVFKEKTIKTVSFLSKYSFGVYLSHMLVLNLLPFGIDILNPVLSVPIVSVAVCVISLLIAFILGKIPVLKKYVI